MVKYMLEDTYKIKSEIICIDADICKDFDAVVAMITHDGSACSLSALYRRLDHVKELKSRKRSLLSTLSTISAHPNLGSSSTSILNLKE